MKLNKKIICAVIGTRFGARTILPALSNLDNVEVKYLCGGTNFKKTKEIAHSFNIPYYTNTFDQIVNDKDLDFIFIATPHHTHHEMIIKALNNQLNIIVEKPLALNLKDTETIIKLTNNYNKINLVTHQLRYLSSFQLIKEKLNSGAIGDIDYIRIKYQTNRLADKNIKWNWCFDDKKGGGMIIAMGSHLIDLIEFFCNSQTESVRTYTQNSHQKLYDSNFNEFQVKVESCFDTHIRLANNINCNIFCTGTSYQEDFLEINIYGKSGEIYYNSLKGAYLYYQDSNDSQFKEILISTESNHSIWKKSFENFIKDLFNNETPLNYDNLVTFEKYNRYFTILKKMEESAKNGKELLIQTS